MSASDTQPHLGDPLTDPAQIAAEESSPATIFPSFTAATAWSLGLALRSRILSLPEGRRRPAVISIALTTGSPLEPHVVFQSATESGTKPDNEIWIRRKRNTVLRFGMSSWALRQKMLAGPPVEEAGVVEAAFVKKFALASSTGGSAADDYTINGGGFPVRVRGVDGIVAVIVVSGLQQEDDHQVIVETVKDCIEGGAK